MARDAISGAGAYPPNLVPALRPGDLAELLPMEKLVRVSSFTPQPGVTVLDSDAGDDITISDGGFEKVELTPLEAQDKELLQLRPLALAEDLPDGVEIEVDFGGEQAPYYETKNARGVLTNATGATAGYNEDSDSVFVADEVQTQLSEIYIYEQEVPFFTFRNNSGGQVTISDIVYSGYRYDLAENGVSQNGMNDPAVPIPVERDNR
jgi:hypothetical protein